MVDYNDTSLSLGFCQASLNTNLSSREYDAHKATWSTVALQVLDIQRFPAEPKVGDISRFYLAASDGQGLIWVVIPPQSDMEDCVGQFQLDVGCRVTVHEYALLQAANGRNVVVPLRLSFSPNPVPLLGSPEWDDSLFCLSPNALTIKKSTLHAAHEDVDRNVFGHFVEVSIEQIIREPSCVLHAWKMDLQLVWTGTPFRSSGVSGMSMEEVGGTSDRHRYTLKTVVMDHHGHLIMAMFYGRLAWLERISAAPSRLWRIANGSVVWEAAVNAVPSHFSFQEHHCVVYPLANGPDAGLDESSSAVGGNDVGVAAPTTLPSLHLFPLHPIAVAGDMAGAIPSIVDILEKVPLDRVVSFVGIVVSFRGGMLTQTKRGSTLRASVTVADPTERLCLMDMTLWGDIASKASLQRGQRYWFHNLTVREFQQKKNVSSRADTLFIPLSDKLEYAEDDDTKVILPTTRRGTGSSEGTATERHADVEQNGAAQIMFVLQLSLGTPTLPVLARVQEVERPFLWWQCSSCRGLLSPVSISRWSPCPRCGSAPSEQGWAPVLRIYVYLSDGVSGLLALCHTTASENLLEVTAGEFELEQRRYPKVEEEVRQRLVGCPVLVWLLRCQSSGEEEKAVGFALGEHTGSDAVGPVTPYLVTNCRHVDFRTCSAALLSSIEGLVSGGRETQVAEEVNA